MCNDILVRPLSNSTDLLRLHELNPQRYPYLLDSAAKGPNARFDILFAFPQQYLKLKDFGNIDTDASVDVASGFLATFDRWFELERSQNSPPDGLPFYGGWFVYLGYELAGEIEPTLHLPMQDRWLPIAYARRIPAAIIFDHQRKQTFWVCESCFSDTWSLLQDDLNALSTQTPETQTRCEFEIREETPQQFAQSLEKIAQYIRAGDVFQVNLSRAWQARAKGAISDAQLYRRLRASNPAPFAGLAKIDDVSILSSSPERLLRREQNQIDTRPIAGTRPRVRDEQGQIDPARDLAAVSELTAHPKERAEHIMLIDLERNDIGRIAIPGTVKVSELMAVESYAHVHHIVSNVCGTIRESISPGDVIRALFPGGTITGCPKVRCMEIIAELEGVPREAYTGSFGYINRNGDMDLNILIRTMMMRGQDMKWRAGGGIVADSIFERELEETRAKARGLLRVFSP